MGFDAKQAKLLSQTFTIASSAFVLFTIGLIADLLYDNYTLGVCLLIFGSLSLLGIVCLPFAAEKMACLWTFGFCAGYYAGVYCQSMGLVASDILFVTIATICVCVSASIATYFSRELIHVYLLTSGIASLLYLPLSIYYMFNGGNAMLLLIMSIAFISSVAIFMYDTGKILHEIENGQPDVWVLATILFQDIFDIFLHIAKLLIAMKANENKKKKNE